MANFFGSVYRITINLYVKVNDFIKDWFVKLKESVNWKEDLKKLNHIAKDILSLSFMQYIISFIISLYIRFVYKTSKIIVKGYTEEYLNSLQQNNSNVVFTWHGRIFIASAFVESLLKKISYKGNIYTIASKHKDGNIAFMSMSFFGFKKIEGSSVNNERVRKKDDSGAFSSAIKILRELKGNNASIFVALDGPKGPRYQINSNIIGLAQKTESMVFPVVISYSNKKEFSSWDKFQLPVPFSKIMIDFLEPIILKKDFNIKEIEKEVQDKMNKSMLQNDKDICE